MRHYKDFSLIKLLLLWLCFNAPMVSASYREDLRETIAHYQAQAHDDLQPDFVMAHEHYPPKKLALLVFKAEKILELWASDGNRWAYIRDFDILAASGGPGPKLTAGDLQVPEGVYSICMLNPYSRFDLSLMIDYPDSFDRQHARMDHRDHLGGDIFIHGGDKSIGCVAIGNHAIEDLFVLVYEVGIHNVKVIIAPNDLRVGPPIMVKRAPFWIGELHHQLQAALKPFPVTEAKVQQT